jgi:ribonuclease D
MMNALAKAEPLEPDDLPAREPRRPGLTKDGALVADLLKLLLKIRAKESGVASKLIARSDELELLASGVRDDLHILSGWRFDEFGRDALDLVEGRLAFATEHGRLKLTRTESIQEPDTALET